MTLTGAILPDMRPYIQIGVRDVSGASLPVNVLVDTGFNGSIALPVSWIARLGLEPTGIEEVEFANLDTVTSRTYDLELEWFGAVRTATLSECPGDPMIGTELMFDCELFARFVHGGPVTIQSLKGG